ncbi:MAG: hypothetical protein EZS28_001011 [Streblomastix strix]|uniref:ATP-dependent DNA helicase n=1 Tax=Streblomastix strix TaxID=222440 RepID=A0A5J4X8F5_9EUKA|nr:MAG: hypothetical protein EZS28_001011 [Streblomastix strix]
MEDNNPYAVSFRSMRNKLDEENEAAQNEGRAIQDFQLCFMKKETRLTEKVYTLTLTDEVAAVSACADEQELQNASQILFQRHGRLKYLIVTDSAKDSMAFPVLFPKGVRKFGHPDLLITFTSNPRWDEILSIIGDDSSANLPDIVQGNETSAALNSNSIKTTLTAFFNLNDECRKQFGDVIDEGEYNSRKYTYDQIPKHSTFNTGKKFSIAHGLELLPVYYHKDKAHVTFSNLQYYYLPPKNFSKITQAKNGLLWNQLQLVEVIIYDKAPMASKWAIESVDKKLKEIRKNDKDFGGVLMIFGGDFRQVFPIVKFGGRNEQVNASIQKSNLWRKFYTVKLKKNMRTGKGSKEFSSFLMQIGNLTMELRQKRND